ncbi:hypothetical protein B9Z19DRAFT_1130384 [Tuber borchii]|uniref:Uncharacterized protein n=1 Tax=Tuber borchii TaxID=42251 RepID=A0A2T6ZKP8_TUBBO|nr:hypothetical protein B9Z19DRAFT_1130384 [Tuber borchii]
MYPNRAQILGEIKTFRPTTRRPEAKVDSHNTSRESAYKARMEKPSLKSAVASASDGSVIAPFPVRATPDEAPLARLGFSESDADGEGEVQDDMDEELEI